MAKLEWCSIEIHKGNAGMVIAQCRSIRAKLEWWLLSGELDIHRIKAGMVVA
jgi:hypothetical protein